MSVQSKRGGAGQTWGSVRIREAGKLQESLDAGDGQLCVACL